MPTIRPATTADHLAIWKILEPTIRAGETYTLPPDTPQAEALAYWFSRAHEVFVAEVNSQILGTYYLRPNQQGNARHTANCGYITAPWATGQGIARAMCEHSLDYARSKGFLAMQFNFVVSTNRRAVKLWKRLGFKIVGEIPEAFLHPTAGYVAAYIMHRKM